MTGSDLPATMTVNYSNMKIGEFKEAIKILFSKVFWKDFIYYYSSNEIATRIKNCTSNIVGMEKIIYACIVTPTGKQYTGVSHSNCYDKMYHSEEKPFIVEDCKEGFLTDKDRFVDRCEAANIALEAGQIEKKVRQLQSYMLDLNRI